MKLFNHSSINSYMLSNFHHWELAMCEEKAGLEEKIKGECMLCSLYRRIQLLPLVLGDDRSRISQKCSVRWRLRTELAIQILTSRLSSFLQRLWGPRQVAGLLQTSSERWLWHSLVKSASCEDGKRWKASSYFEQLSKLGRARYTVKCERQVRNREDVLFAN